MKQARVDQPKPALSEIVKHSKRGYVIDRFKTHPQMLPQSAALEVPVADKPGQARNGLGRHGRSITLARGESRKTPLQGPYGLTAGKDRHFINSIGGGRFLPDF